MKKVYLFGSGGTALNIIEKIGKNVEILGFLDNNITKHGDVVAGFPVVGSAESIEGKEFDEIIICSLTGKEQMREQLLAVGVDANKINTTYVEVQIEARINFLYDFAELTTHKYGNVPVAECGVYQGEFAKHINYAFPHNKLYLFDTFEGFDKKNAVSESSGGGYDYIKEGAYFLNTSVELVLSKMRYPNNVIICKGVFPKTAEEITEKEFVFVNLDFDLYMPTIAGLNFFYSRLVQGGVILVHDYYNPIYPGIRRAIDEFLVNYADSIIVSPIGDHFSMALFKK